jgi:translation initiation factor IF-2
MPPRFVYWTIIAGGLPTAFRATDREELLPTFRRLKEKHPDAELKWFARGKLWDSKEAADLEREQRRAQWQERERGPARPRTGTARGRDWRPGGEHKDPRQKYKNAKKARNLDRRKAKFVRKQADGPRRDWTTRPAPPAGRPAGRSETDRPRPERRPRPAASKPPGEKPRGDWRDRPQRPDWRDRPPRDNTRSESGRPQGSGRAPAGPKTTSSKPAGPGTRPRGSRPGGPPSNRPGGSAKARPGAWRDRDRKGPNTDKRRK